MDYNISDRGGAAAGDKATSSCRVRDPRLENGRKPPGKRQRAMADQGDYIIRYYRLGRVREVFDVNNDVISSEPARRLSWLRLLDQDRLTRGYCLVGSTHKGIQGNERVRRRALEMEKAEYR